MQDGGEDFGRPVVALVGRDCRIEPGEVVIARLTKLSRSVAGKLVVVRGSASRMRRARGCMGRHWRSRPRTGGSCVRRCAPTVRGSRPRRKIVSPERLGATAGILPYRASMHGVIGPSCRWWSSSTPSGVTVNCISRADPNRHHGSHPGGPKDGVRGAAEGVRRSAEPEEAAQMTLSLLLPAACTSRAFVGSMAGDDPERVRPAGLQTIRQPNVKGASAW